MNQRTRGRVQTTLCAGLVIASFLAFGPTLDRYPGPYIDDSFFNYPAIRYLGGRGFNYNVSSQAPHGDTIWAYHGPFYPRLQILTFSALGVSQFTSRIPQYLAAHIAVLALCGFLLRNGLPFSAVALAALWIGDRSSQEVQYGRMEGLALLCLALGFMAFVKVAQGAGAVYAAACGASLGFAVGFNPTALSFPLICGAALIAWRPSLRRGRTLVVFGMGAALPLALFLWCWSPDVSGAFEQFRWLIRYTKSRTLSEKVANCLDVLRWSRSWAVTLVAANVAFLVPTAIWSWLSGGIGPQDRRSILWLAATVFSTAGLACVFGSTVLPYYLVYFTTWTTMGLVVFLETHRERGLIRAAAMTIGLTCLLSWMPSLAWNFLRFRESVREYNRLDPAPISARLAQAVPRGAKVTGSPEMLFLSTGAGLNFEPLPWFGERTDVARTTYLLLTDSEWREPRRVDPRCFRSRPRIDGGAAFPGSKYLGFPFVLLGPVPDRSE